MGHKVPTIDLHVAVICGSYHNPFVVSEKKKKTLGARVVITGLSFCVWARFGRGADRRGSVGTEEERDWSVPLTWRKRECGSYGTRIDK